MKKVNVVWNIRFSSSHMKFIVCSLSAALRATHPRTAVANIGTTGATGSCGASRSGKRRRHFTVSQVMRECRFKIEFYCKREK